MIKKHSSVFFDKFNYYREAVDPFEILKHQAYHTIARPKNGNYAVHKALEDEVANFIGTKYAMVFTNDVLDKALDIFETTRHQFGLSV